VVACQTDSAGDPSLLLPAEAASLGRAVPKRVREFAAGRACARRALSELGIADFALGVGPDREPLWPDGFVGSITHTEGLCAAVVAARARHAGLGIDAERRGAVQRHLWPSICGPDERAWLETFPLALAIDLATVLFAAKEAFYKAQFPLVRERLHFHDVAIRVDAADPAAGRFAIEPRRALRIAEHASLPLAGSYRIDGGFICAGIAIAAAREAGVPAVWSPAVRTAAPVPVAVAVPVAVPVAVASSTPREAQ
jgi:4'-phosphopantetheinyl transferase EntD